MKAITVGIAGTAKNTGKTTTTSAIMESIKKDQELSLAITSIGYDGEDLDNITGLPKPKIHVWPGVLVAVAEKCLPYSEAEVEIIHQTNISTPLGKIILGKVKKGGRVVIAGPNKSGELREILNQLRHQANMIIVDGALNRIAPMVEVDALVLATGAARNFNISSLAFETHCIAEILGYKILEVKGETAAFNCILSKEEVDQAILQVGHKSGLIIKGIIGELSFEYLVEQRTKLRGKTILFSDAIKLLLCGDVKNIHALLNKLKSASVHVGVQRQINIAGITINPYYPKYRFSSDDYEEAYVDEQELFQQIKKNVFGPVFNVVRQGGEGILKNIMVLR